MDEVYKPGAVSSLIHLQPTSDGAEKSRKEQKKLDKLFGRTTKKNSTTSIIIPQDDYSDDLSENVDVKIKSSKKKKKKETDVELEEVESSTRKKKKKKTPSFIDDNDDDINNSQEDSFLGKKKNDKINHVKEKKRNSEDIISTFAKKPKKFKEVATDDNKLSKKGKKRKIEEEEVVACPSGQDEEEEGDDTSSGKKKKKLNKDAEDTSETLSYSPKKPRQRTTPPVINDILCARKESDGSKSWTRTTKKQDLSDIEDEDDDGQRPQKRQKKKRDKKNDRRTVFVGNLPLTMNKKQLKQMFSPCGQVENLRMRGAIPANPQRGKKYAILKAAYHSKCRSINAYICFVDKESADKACDTMNGTEIEGQHIRVNSSIVNKTPHDHKRSVFIGNLPFVISDEDVRQHFLDCGEIADIRLVRDWKTGVGKGFGYVKFVETDSAELAIKLDNSKLKTRKVRVSPSETDPKNKRAEKGPAKKEKIKKNDEKDFVGVKAEKKKKKQKPKHLARKMGLTPKKTDLIQQKPVAKTTGGPNKHMVFQ